MRVHHVGLRHRPRRLRTTPWRVIEPSTSPIPEPDGEAPLDAWLAFARQHDTGPARATAVEIVTDLPVTRPVIHGHPASGL